MGAAGIDRCITIKRKATFTPNVEFFKHFYYLNSHVIIHFLRKLIFPASLYTWDNLRENFKEEWSILRLTKRVQYTKTGVHVNLIVISNTMCISTTFIPGNIY